MFALDDDYSMALLSSTVHTDWARGRSSTLEDRIRYTPSSAFETFPWPPAPSETETAQITTAGAAMLTRRSEICRAEGIGLTRLYNLVDDGAYAELRALQDALDAAVERAYGWPVRLEHTERNARLLELNREICSGEVEYRGPGHRYAST